MCVCAVHEFLEARIHMKTTVVHKTKSRRDPHAHTQKHTHKHSPMKQERQWNATLNERPKWKHTKSTKRYLFINKRKMIMMIIPP